MPADVSIASADGADIVLARMVLPTLAGAAIAFVLYRLALLVGLPISFQLPPYAYYALVVAAVLTVALVGIREVLMEVNEQGEEQAKRRRKGSQRYH